MGKGNVDFQAAKETYQGWGTEDDVRNILT